MKTKNNIEDVNIYYILDEYRPDDNIFSLENENINKIKHIIYDILNETDRRIILLYAELGNIRDVAKILKVSSGTAFLQIKRIQKTIRDKYDLH